ncbi:MAG: hypothetical protein Fur0032_21960 [Terrimicrobiaceae bacterium]
MNKQELIAELAKSRTAIARDFRATQAALDVRARLAHSFNNRPFAWLGGAAAVGWLFAGRRRAKAQSVKKAKSSPARGRPAPAPLGWAGLVLTLLRLAMPVIKPAFSAYAARRFADMAEKLAKG